MCFNLMKIMGTSFNLRLPAIVLFLLLLCLHLRLLLALPLNHMVTADLGHEEQNGKEEMSAKQFPNSGEPGSKHEIEVVKKHGGGAEPAAHGGGGEHGNAGNGGGDNGRGSGGQIPVYAAGSMNHNRDHQHHGSNSGTINGFCSSCLALIVFACISVYEVSVLV